VRRALVSPLAALLAAVAVASAGAAPPQQRFDGNAVVPPRPAAPFALSDAHGRRFALTARPGRYVLVTFLYTHCPDICPLIAANLNAALGSLTPAERRHVEVLAVSVDPRGDTPAAVRRYERTKGLRPEFHYLVGSRRALAPVWAKYGVAAVQRTPDLVDHVAYTALVDPQGRERVLYDSTVRARQVVHDLRVLMRRA
jgi:protein SCO1/2